MRRLIPRIVRCLVALAPLAWAGCAGIPHETGMLSKLSRVLPPSPLLETDDSLPEPESDRSPATSDAKISRHRSLDEMLLFHPSRYPDGNWTPENVEFQDVRFTASDGTRLHAWYFPARRPRAQVLFLHGNAGHVAGWANYGRLLQEKLGVSCLLIDYRGYGRSEGTPTTEGVLADARAGRDELGRLAGISPAEVVLMGRSLGGALAVQLAAETPCRGLIVESSFTSLKDIARHHFSRLAWIVPGDRLDSVSAIARVRSPLLLSHGDADRVIPFEHGVRLYEAAAGPKTFLCIPQGDHNDPPTADYLLQLDRYFASLANTVRPETAENRASIEPLAPIVP